jgi:hypothetical protein
MLTWGGWAPQFTYFSYVSAFTQHLMGEWNTSTFGGLYRKDNERGKMAWDWGYTYMLKNLVDIIYNTEGKPEYDNLRSIARIFKVYAFMVLTDLYGDIPYFEGAQGHVGNISQPQYDKQEAIYKDFLKELAEIEATLGEDGGLVTGDIIYNGDIDKWKRFANSLRLRVAMRIVYAEPGLAKDEVFKLLLSPAGFILPGEDALIKYMDINSWEGTELRRNALAQSWRSRDPHPNQTICATFFNHLKNTGDPRIFRLTRCYYDLPAAENDPWGRIDITDEMLTLYPDSSYFQPVLPGYTKWQNWPMQYYSTVAGAYVNISCRPQVSNDFLKGSSPGILMTYAEVQLLLAEAEIRWSELFSGETAAEEYYTGGVTAAMNLLLKWGVKPYSANEISAYLVATPFPAGKEEQIRAINEQLWILHFNNPPEAWANVRRSHYPELKPSRDYGVITEMSDIIPTRLCYPNDESAYNGENQKAAFERMDGTDNWNARVWWNQK